MRRTLSSMGYSTIDVVVILFGMFCLLYFMGDVVSGSLEKRTLSDVKVLMEQRTAIVQEIKDKKEVPLRVLEDNNLSLEEIRPYFDQEELWITYVPQSN